MKSKAVIDEQVLELYDGRMARHNGKPYTAMGAELKFSARGKELYALCESFYGRWLEKADAPRSLLDKSIEICREAAAEGYPHAVVKLAYFYDKDYVALDRTEEFRCRVACDYYRKVVFCENAPKGIEEVTPAVWEEVKRIAACRLIDMLAGAQKSLSDYGNGTYSYEENLRLIRQRNIAVSTDNRHLPQRGERDKADFMETVFYACKHNKTRAPLFGVMSITAASAKRVFAPKSMAMKMCGDLNIWLFNGEKLLKVNNTANFKNFVGEIAGENNWVFFFNNNLGGHRYVNGKQRKELCELMMKDNYARFKRLTQSAEERGRSEYLFSDDDIQFFLCKKSKLRNALDSLIDKVAGDTDWWSD